MTITFEKRFHRILKSAIINEFKNSEFRVKEEYKMGKSIIDMVCENGNQRILFGCEVPTEYEKFLRFKNADTELLERGFRPKLFAKKCLNKVQTVFENTGIVPILVVPENYFSGIIEMYLVERGVSVWLVNMESLKIQKRATQNTFEIRIDEIKRAEGILDYLLNYFSKKYGVTKNRKYVDALLKMCMQNENLFNIIKQHYRNKNFVELNKFLEELTANIS